MTPKPNVATGALVNATAGGALMLTAMLVWLAAMGAWAARHVPICFAPRVDGRPG